MREMLSTSSLRESRTAHVRPSRSPRVTRRIVGGIIEEDPQPRLQGCCSASDLRQSYRRHGSGGRSALRSPHHPGPPLPEGEEGERCRKGAKGFLFLTLFPSLP